MNLLWVLHFPIFAEYLNSYKPGNNKCKHFNLFSIYSVSAKKRYFYPLLQPDKTTFFADTV